MNRIDIFFALCIKVFSIVYVFIKGTDDVYVRVLVF